MSDISEAKKKLLSTSSPEGLQVASQITPTRIANFLIREGPQPIRRINSQLAMEVSGFDSLSLSKQRRLIMAAMEQVDSENNCVFEKIGWGQWAVRKVDSEYIESKDNDTERRMSVQDLRSQGVKLGWSKKSKKTNALSANSGVTSDRTSMISGSDPLDSTAFRRQSISTGKHNLHNINVPRGSAVSDSEDDFALSDEEEEEEEEEDEEEEEEEHEDDENNNGLHSESESEIEYDEGVFTIDDTTSITKFKPKPMKSSPPIKFANRVPLKVSPPPVSQGQRRRSSNSSVSKPRFSQQFSRSRLNSLDALDDYIGSPAKGSCTSLSPVPTTVLSTSPWNRGNYIHQTTSPESMGFNTSRRRSSFNESNIRSTLSSSLPKHQVKPIESTLNSRSTVGVVPDRGQLQANNIHMSNGNTGEDTDEEDWASMGAESLREKAQKKLSQESDERKAAYALVNLMSV